MNLISSISAHGPAIALPPGKRTPFGWPAMAVPAPGGGDLILAWLEEPACNGASILCLTTAIDDRECKRIAVLDATGATLGEFDLRYAHALQTFAISLAHTSGPLTLRMTHGTTPLWCVAPETAAQAPGFAPHLIDAAPPADPAAALLGHLRSSACQHTWGWLEGCVLDGLERLAAVSPGDGYERALHRHLEKFFPANGRLIAENLRSEPHDDAIDTIESTLMFAPLAAAHPGHPWLDRVIAWWKQETGPDGTVLDGAMLSAEGSYTVAYPMARLARLRHDETLANSALRQLAARREHLWHDDALYLRWVPATDERTFRNWARGVTRHFLGNVRTALELREHREIDALWPDFQRLAELALRTQRPDGLWACFLDDPAGVPDTSGSAGLATALALAAREGLIAPAARAAAERTWSALLPFITADGRLGGVAQGNRGGEALQRSDYRVLSAMGAGLAAQLHAALTAPAL